MTTLMIKDLSSSVELDSKAMTAVAGGLYLGRVRRQPYWGGAPKLSFSVTDIDSKSVIADQDLAQVMNLSTATGVNAAFVDHLKSDVNAHQHGSNNINV
jgi:hypothetical protein